MPWMPERQSFRPGLAPDPLEIWAHLETYGISTTLLDPNKRPWNPLCNIVNVIPAWGSDRIISSPAKDFTSQSPEAHHSRDIILSRESIA
jgi:hypothetical protein